MARLIIFLVFVFAASIGTAAAPAGVTRQKSLDDDLAGPRVVWLGRISGILTEADDTCFVLDRVEELYGGYALTATKFVACNPGNFEGEAFLPGKILQVEGNLGAAILRRVGGQDLNAHLVAAPNLTSLPNLTAYRAPPGYYDYPYTDPYFSPWYPGFGIGFGYHHRRWR